MFDTLLAFVVNNYYQHKIIVLAIACGLAFFAWFKPKVMAKVVFFAFLLLVCVYIGSFLGESSSVGVASKHESYDKTLQEIERDK